MIVLGSDKNALISKDQNPSYSLRSFVFVNSHSRRTIFSGIHSQLCGHNNSGLHDFDISSIFVCKEKSLFLDTRWNAWPTRSERGTRRWRARPCSAMRTLSALPSAPTVKSDTSPSRPWWRHQWPWLWPWPWPWLWPWWRYPGRYDGTKIANPEFVAELISGANAALHTHGTVS